MKFKDVIFSKFQMVFFDDFTRVCGSKQWVQQMVDKIPFTDIETLLDLANTTWFLLPVSEWKAAFAA